MRYTATYLIYFAILARAIAWNQDNPPIEASAWAALGVYGLLLATEPALTRRLPGYPRWYPLAQSGLVLGMLFLAPELDFLPSLFVPLSFQVVLFFGWRVGFLWIGAFNLLMAGLMMLGWEWELAGVAMVLLYWAINFMVGSYADRLQRTERVRQENQRLLGELRQAHRRLQDYADQVEELAAAQERHYLARELHDSVTQTLFSMNLAVQAARLLADKDLSSVGGQLDRLGELTRSASGEIQALADQLRPRPVPAAGLVAALRQLAAERQARDGLQIYLEVSGARDLPATVSVGLYRIVQEALNNVSKHSGAGQATIRLSLESRPAQLEVEDRGCGFDPRCLERGPGHLGLVGMQERACELGWQLEIDSQPGRGTRIRLEEVRDGEPLLA